MRRINKYILTWLSLTVLMHSISWYSLPAEVAVDDTAIETSHDSGEQLMPLKAYDALIPSIQGMAPMVLYFIHEVVLLSEFEYKEVPVHNDFENQFLKILFPLIISPNAP